MRGVVALAGETAVDVGGLLPVDELGQRLGPPFTVAVCGEVNSGKSTLLNALFGAPMCRVNVLPETTKVVHYHHGAREADEAVSDSTISASRAWPFLRDFEVIDTPGTNTADRGPLEDAAARFSTVDLLLCVFPVSNPWGAATWNFIGGLGEAILDRTVFVLHQADQRDPRDLEIIRGHLRDLSMQRLGRFPAVFEVSGREAFDARSGAAVNQPRLRASGIEALERHIAAVVCMAPGRVAMLKEWRSMAAAALRAVEDRLEEQTRGIAGHSRFLEEVEEEIEAICEHFVKRLPGHLVEVAEVFEREAHGVVHGLRRKLGLLPSIWRLFTRDTVGRATEQVFIMRLKSAVEEVAAADADEAIAACRQHWAALAPRVAATLGIRIDHGDQVDAAFQESRAAFIRRLGTAATQGVAELNTRRQLDDDLRLRNKSLTSFAIATLSLTTVGAIAGALGLPWVPWIFCGLAGLFLTGGVVAAVATRRSISADYLSGLLDTCGMFAQTLRDDSEAALRRMFQEHTRNLGSIRGHLVRENQLIEPRQRRWQELFLGLKAVEQEW